jgi:hypothetical protein
MKSRLLHLLHKATIRRNRKLACEKLQRIVDANKRAPATQEFARKRAAMLRHTRGLA